MSLLYSCILPHPPILVPEVGRGNELDAKPTFDAYREVAARAVAHRPQTIVIVSPHQSAYADYFAVNQLPLWRADLSDFGVPRPEIQADLDKELADAIIESARSNDLPVGYQNVFASRVDHGTWVPLYFLARAGLARQAEQVSADGGEVLTLDARVVILSISGLAAERHFQYGRSIADAINKSGRDVVFVASADLSHKLKESGPYGFDAAGPRFEAWFDQVIDSGDLRQFLEMSDSEAEPAAVCGLQSSQILAGVMDHKPYRLNRLSHEWPFGIGYAVVEVIPNAASVGHEE